MSKVVRVVIADDHSIFREGIQLLLKKEKSIELTGEAADGDSLLALIDEVQPHVVVTDIEMPGKSGLDVTRIVKKKQPHVGIIAFTMFGEDELVVDMMEAGANGYVLKSSKKEELLKAILSASEGGTYFCDETSGQLSKMLAASKTVKKQEPVEFTETELEVIRLICKEKSNKEIATDMQLAVKTVEKIKSKLFEKTGSLNSVGVAVFAMQNGFYTP